MSSQESVDAADWTEVIRRSKRPKKERPPVTSQESRSRAKEYARKAAASATMSARMPDVLMKEDTKIVLRPRGGLNIVKTPIPVMAAAVTAAAKISGDEASGDTFLPNNEQNIMVVSTPDLSRARKYAKIQEIKIGKQVHEVGAYMTVPDGVVKGVIRGVPVEHTPTEIDQSIVTKMNPTALGAKCIGTSTTVIVAFEDEKVPDYVSYGPAVMQCSLYRKHYDVFKTCGKVGRKKDVGPTPNARVCFDCGAKNPGEGHAEVCKPRCKLCDGKHLTVGKGYKNKFKIPYIVTKGAGKVGWLHKRS